MPTVEFHRSAQVGAPLERVWGVVTDASMVAGWLDIVGEVEELEQLSRYTAVLTDRLGPFRLSADLDITVTEVEQLSHVKFIAEGEDRQISSRIRVEATMATEDTLGGSRIHVTGKYEVTGRVATLGASMIRTKGERILDEFFSAMTGELG